MRHCTKILRFKLVSGLLLSKIQDWLNQTLPIDSCLASTSILRTRSRSAVTSFSASVLPVPSDKRAEYTAAAKKMADLFVECGAISVVDAWSDDVPEGKVNSFHTAVLKKPGEDIVFSWINWKDQAAHDAGWEKAMADPRMGEFGPQSVGADMGRMIYGTFRPIVVA